MRISFACNNIGTGGAERVLCGIANRMSLDGHDVRIICYKKLDSFYYHLEKKVEIIELDPNINSRNSFISRKFAGIFNLKRLFDAVKGSDCVISFYTRQNCYSILVCRLLHIPVICAERDSRFMTDGKINHIMRKVFYPFANGFIHQTKMAQEYLRKHEGVKCKDIVIPNPIWMESFADRKEIEGYVSTVGRIDAGKNIDGIIRAFAGVLKDVPYASLHIWGEGPNLDEYKALVLEKGLTDSIFFEGHTNDVSQVYLQSEVFVLFSHGEGYPNVLMEALAFGTPSVASDCPVGGPRDMINNGVNGFLVENENEEALSSAITRLLKNEALREKFSDSCIAIRESNSFQTIYEKWMHYIHIIYEGENVK